MINLFLSTIKSQSRSKLFMIARKMYLYTHIPMDFPIILNVDPTNACNLLCSMCPNSKPNNMKKYFMDYGLYKKIVDEVAERRKKLYRFFLVKDGEPLLHKKIVDMVEYAKSKNISRIITIVTNGVLLNEEMARGFIESGLDDIGISIDAVSKEKYLERKGKDNYDVVVDNVLRLIDLKKRLGRKRPIVRVKFVEPPDAGVNEKKEFIGFWKGKADKVEINPYHNWAGELDVEQTGELKKKSERYPCSLLWYTMVVNSNGTVSLCCIDYYWKTVVGDVNKSSLYEIWNGSKMEEIRMKHILGEYKDIPLCNTCTYWKIKENIGKFLKWKYKKTMKKYI